MQARFIKKYSNIMESARFFEISLIYRQTRKTLKS
jgi:hypothetical protein